MSPSDKFLLLASFLFPQMAAGDSLPAQTEVTISSHPSCIIKPSAALKDGAEALPSQQSNLEEDLEPAAPKPPKKAKKHTHITETSEEEDKEDFSGCKDAQMNPNPKSM